MNICVYGSADLLNETCMNAAKELGKYIGEKKHTLIFNGYGDGLLGTVAQEVWKNNGDIISILPEQPQTRHIKFIYSTIIYHPKYKIQRQKLLEKYADIFIVMPEGLDVLDELLETLRLKKHGIHDKPVYIVDISPKYDLLLNLLEQLNYSGLYTVISENDFARIS